MTFEKQVKEAKEKQLQSRIIRDVVFLLLGIIFLVISIFSSIREKDNKENNEVTKSRNINTTINF